MIICVNKVLNRTVKSDRCFDNLGEASQLMVFNSDYWPDWSIKSQMLLIVVIGYRDSKCEIGALRSVFFHNYNGS